MSVRELWGLMPLSEKIGAVLFPFGFCALIWGIAVITPN